MTQLMRLRSLLCTVITAPLLLAPLSAFAINQTPMYYKGEVQPCPQVKLLNDGLYVGIGGGYDSFRNHENINASINGDTFSANPVINSTGFVGGIFTGYGLYFAKLLYLAGEAYVNISGASATATYTDAVEGTSYNSKLSAGTSFGVALLPGIKVNDSSLLYFRVGSVWSNLENKENVFSGGLTSGSDTKNWLHGVTFGLGVETVLYKAFSVRTEFTHTNYNNSSYTPLGTYYSAVDNQAMLGLIYHVNN